ncbi:hypothetical protein [Asanoa sp. NPDC050611]|uniref:hypothetical protein n=1 Tax=Asanoa sp. NPDC050611 TaxID=3157098 RepID=UPI0033C109C5
MLARQSANTRRLGWGTIGTHRTPAGSGPRPSRGITARLVIFGIRLIAEALVELA